MADVNVPVIAPDVAAESLLAAKEAGLTYVSDRDPGIHRIRSGKGFRYIDPQGRPVREEDTLRRIRSLVIPPAWTDVWICTSSRGHLQATGRDARGRKQYRYHPRYRSQRDEQKFEGLIEFAEALPRIRRRVSRDLGLRGLPKERALATVVAFLDKTSIRVGNAEYARDNHSFGATTLKTSHARVKGASIQLRFKGKSGRLHTLELNNRRLAAIVRRCHDLPGQELFQYLDENGEPHPVDSAMVNEYLRTISGRDITAKHFRTWHGTLNAAMQLTECGIGASDTENKRNIVAAVKAVSEHLGNRPATCRKYYIYPGVLDEYTKGGLGEAMSIDVHPRRHFSEAEQRVLQLLRHGFTPAIRKTVHRERKSPRD